LRLTLHSYKSARLTLAEPIGNRVARGWTCIEIRNIAERSVAAVTGFLSAEIVLSYMKRMKRFIDEERTDRMPFANVNGQRLYFEDTGGAGPVIIFSHGFPLDGTMFAPQVAALRGKYRCIVWDERGHGKSAGKVLAPFSYYDSADDLAALLAFLGVDSAVLVGVSQGAFLAMRCALVHPERVRALILIAAETGVNDPATLESYSKLLDAWIASDLPEDVAATIVDVVFGPDWPGAAAWKERWRAMTAPNLRTAFDALASRDDIGDKVSAIRVPTLVIHGDADAAIPLARAQAMKVSIPDAEMVVASGGHSVNLTNPAPVNAAIEAFLKRHHLAA
jgi:pimeloyl-ACP methyl ester carboxylesterase